MRLFSREFLTLDSLLICIQFSYFFPLHAFDTPNNCHELKILFSWLFEWMGSPLNSYEYIHHSSDSWENLNILLEGSFHHDGLLFYFFFKIRGKNERRLFGLVKWIFHEFRDFANIILCVYTVKPQIIWMLIKVLKYFSSQEWGVIFWMKKSALYKHFPHFISFFYCPRAFHYSNHLTFPSHYGLVKMFPFHVISLVVLAACLQTENGMKNLCNIYFARWKNSFLVTVD